MKMKLDVELADGTTQRVVVSPVTQVAYEREFKKPIDGTLGTQGLYWMAWHALRTGVKFDEWLPELVGADPVDDADDSADFDPLAPTPPSGDSLPLPSNPAQG